MRDFRKLHQKMEIGVRMIVLAGNFKFYGQCSCSVMFRNVLFMQKPLFVGSSGRKCEQQCHVRMQTCRSGCFCTSHLHLMDVLAMRLVNWSTNICCVAQFAL